MTGNVLTVGSTRSGKTTSEIVKVVEAARRNDCAIVVCDPHPGSLAAGVFKQLVNRGHASRILYDQIPNFDAALGYRFLRPSIASNPARRASENDQSAREFMDVLTRRREVNTLNTAPLLEEYTYKPALLMLSQATPRDDSDIVYSLQPRSKIFRELLDNCVNEDILRTFLEMESGVIKPAMYAPADRLIRGVCGSPAFIIRCGSRFDLFAFLDRKGILLVEGGTTGVSEDAVRTIMGSVILQVIHYVRSRTRPCPRVLLVLDEATNCNLIGGAGHEARALAECQKMGLDVHILVQNPKFPTTEVTETVFTNCVTHEWFFNASDAVCRLGAADLGDPEYRQRIRSLRTGEKFVTERGRVRYEEVVPLDDPWGFPQLSAKKAEQALAQIRQRPEYQEASCLSEKFQSGTRETAKSSPSPGTTSSSPDTFNDSSPAKRLDTGGSPSSEKEDNCGSSEPSS